MQSPDTTTDAAIHWSLNQTMGVLLRNLTGASPALPGTLRRLAYRAAKKNRPLKVLEATYGFPLIGIELLRAGSIRNKGDFLQYYSGKEDLDDVHATTVVSAPVNTQFKTPNISITVVSPEDYFAKFLEGGLPQEEYEDKHLRQRLGSLLYKEGSKKQYDLFPPHHVLAEEYADAKSETFSTGLWSLGSSVPRLRVLEGDVVDSLTSLANEEFDLIFCAQHMFTPERIALVQGLQGLLNFGGVGYLPLESWTPPSSGSHKDKAQEGKLLADTVKGEPLEQYLAREHPEAYEVCTFPGAETLLLKGTKQDIILPQLTGEPSGKTLKDYGSNPPEYYPDAPVLIWR